MVMVKFGQNFGTKRTWGGVNFHLDEIILVQIVHIVQASIHAKDQAEYIIFCQVIIRAISKISKLRKSRVKFNM